MASNAENVSIWWRHHGYGLWVSLWGIIKASVEKFVPTGYPIHQKFVYFIFSYKADHNETSHIEIAVFFAIWNDDTFHRISIQSKYISWAGAFWRYYDMALYVWVDIGWGNPGLIFACHPNVYGYTSQGMKALLQIKQTYTSAKSTGPWILLKAKCLRLWKGLSWLTCNYMWFR